MRKVESEQVFEIVVSMRGRGPALRAKRQLGKYSLADQQSGVQYSGLAKQFPTLAASLVISPSDC